MERIEHRTVSVNGLNMHVAELGEGPLVLFIHGFPELWYSWRHQILFMASRGYRAVAPDLRGYGDTTGAPLSDPSKFSVLHLVADLVALLQAIAPHQDNIFVVGHDWGAIIAWHLCLFRPDKVRALLNLSVAFIPRHPHMSIVSKMRSFYGDDHYMCRFQEPRDIEAEFAQIGVPTLLTKLLLARNPAPLYFPKDKAPTPTPTSSHNPIPLPSWLSQQDLDYYVTKFDQTGFTGGINYYRALDLSWELTAPWSGAKVNVPTKFILGDLDLTYHVPGVKEYIHNGGFQRDVPLLEEVVVMEDTAHFINQERPGEISNYIFEFFQKF